MTTYSENESRPADNFVVVFFKSTYSVRLFETTGKVYSFYPGIRHSMKREVFQEPADLLKVFSLPQLLNHVSSLSIERNTPSVFYDKQIPMSVANAFWALCQKVGDRVIGNPGTSGKNKKDEYRFKFDLITEDVLKSFPKQARQILLEMITVNRAVMSPEQVEVVMKTMHKAGRLKTKQDPFLIFRYYAPQFYDKGLLSYPGRRLPGEESDAPDPVEEGEVFTLQAAE